jgi:DNA-directed RNA polymerase specialized sigma24 family protein
MGENGPGSKAGARCPPSGGAQGAAGLRRNERERAGSSDLVLETVRGNATALLGLARRYSICADDAHDAYQRGIEIFLRRVDTVEPETALAWLRTVVRRTFDL